MRILGFFATCLCLAACAEEEPVFLPGLAFVDAYETAYEANDAQAFFKLHTKASQRHLVTHGMPENRERTPEGWFMEFRRQIDPKAPSPLGGPYARERREGGKVICVIRQAGGTKERELTLVEEDGAWKLDLLDTYMPFVEPDRH